jgi:hypothetical protein
MAVLSKFLPLCCLQPDEPEPNVDEKTPLLSNSGNGNPTKGELADEIVAKLFAAERNDEVLDAELRSAVHAYGWYDGLAAAVLEGLKRAIELGKEMGPAMRDAYEKAVTALNKVKEWAEENPVMAGVIITLIALGVMAVIVPWMLTFLGFAESGIIEGKFSLLFAEMSIDSSSGSWAALWQATYRGFVPKGSLFSYLQSLGTKIGLGA